MRVIKIPRSLLRGVSLTITPNFLRKMAVQASQGVALLIDHPWKNLGISSIPYGRTFDSKIVQEGSELSLYADHYMIKGQEINDISTDQLAAGIDGGTIFDTSAGFVTTKHTCSICNGNYFGSSDGPACSHYRGNLYEGKECLVLADDGYLMENSLVFDGGYEGAGIVKNSLSRAETEEVNQDIQLKPLALDAKSLNGDGSVFYFFSKKTSLNAYVQDGKPNVLAENEGVDSMSDLQKQAEAALALAQSALGVSNGLLTQIRTALGVSNGLLTQIRTALGVATDEGILSKITSVNSLAQVGEQYKTKITDAACGAGVRAMGDAFNVEAMKLSLANLPVAEIEKINASYEAQALVALGGGGRHSNPADINLPANALNGAPANPNADGTEKTPEQLQALAKTEARAALERTGTFAFNEGG
jgi:hypothetical protein